MTKIRLDIEIEVEVEKPQEMCWPGLSQGLCRTRSSTRSLHACRRLCGDDFLAGFTMRPPKNFHPEPFTYHQEIELRIDDLTNLGDGVGRIDGWVVMVPYALPGERVRARVWRNKSNYSEADLVDVLEFSPARRVPQCALFGQCGGCQYQHLDYDAQLEWKTRQVRELLRRLGGD